MTESQELFEPSQFNEDELIAQILNEEEKIEPEPSTSKQTDQEPKSSTENIIHEKQTKFPLSRIKAIMKMDPDLHLTSQEAVFLVSKATEIFLENLVKETYTYTAKAKRKTVQRRDVDAAIENSDPLCFLEGALDF